MSDTTIKAEDVTLYWGSGSAPCFKVMIALEEKGLGGYESKQCSFSKKEHKSEDVMNHNPRGQLPTMVVKVGGGKKPVVVNESLAAILFLERALHGCGTNLIPCDITGMALVLQRMIEADNFHRKGVEKIAVRRLFSKEEMPLDLTDEKEAFLKELEIWENYLKNGPFLCGPELTAADVIIFPSLAFLVRLGFPLASRPRLAAYYAMMKERPSVKAAWPPHWKDSEGQQLMADV